MFKQEEQCRVMMTSTVGSSTKSRHRRKWH